MSLGLQPLMEYKGIGGDEPRVATWLDREDQQVHLDSTWLELSRRGEKRCRSTPFRMVGRGGILWRRGPAHDDSPGWSRPPRGARELDLLLKKQTLSPFPPISESSWR